MPGDPAAQTTHTHTHTQKQTATSAAFWPILMAPSQQSDTRRRQYSAVATLKVQGPLKLPSGPVTQGPLLRRAGAPFKAVFWLS